MKSLGHIVRVLVAPALAIMNRMNYVLKFLLVGVTIAISDTGGGIPEDIRDRIFDPFFTTKEVGRGTGQGLAIARTVIVGKHGGELSFDSEMGNGTTFTIRLPTRGNDKLGAAA